MKSKNQILLTSLFICVCLLTLLEANFLNRALEWMDYKVFNCRIQHCCNDFQFNSTALEIELNEKVHGQHLVANNVVSILGGHFMNKDPSHALVLSFHGWTGCGKNFVSRIIAKHVFKEGLNSNHVKMFMPTHDFPHASQIEKYKDILMETIRSQVMKCSRSIFIFDEVDKMPIGLVDTIRPFLERLQSLNGVDYRKATFIFLSNTGSTAINQLTYNHWKAGGDREGLTLAVMEEAIANSAYNEVQGGLWHASLIQLNLISAFIPFLPLTKQHVHLCIRDELVRYQLLPEENLVKQISEELQYWPDDYQLFSKSGCKRISQKVETVYFSRHTHRIEL